MPDAPPTLFRRLHHVCLVVHDIVAAEAAYERMGVGPWHDYPPLSDYTELDVPNTDAFLGMRYRWCDLENVQLQLCQPPFADCPQRRFLEEKGEGVFHIGFVVPDIDASEAEGRAAGLGVLMRGRRPDRTGFTYFDTEADAGVVLLARRSPK